MQVGCHMEEQEYGTFKPVWTRSSVKFDESDRAWQKNLDIVCPGRYVSFGIMGQVSEVT